MSNMLNKNRLVMSDKREIIVKKDEIFTLIIKDEDKVLFKDYVKCDTINWSITGGLSIKFIAVATNKVYTMIKDLLT